MPRIEPGLLGEKREPYLCAMLPPTAPFLVPDEHHSRVQEPVRGGPGGQPVPGAPPRQDDRVPRQPDAGHGHLVARRRGRRDRAQEQREAECPLGHYQGQPLKTMR